MARPEFSFFPNGYHGHVEDRPVPACGDHGILCEVCAWCLLEEREARAQYEYNKDHGIPWEPEPPTCMEAYMEHLEELARRGLLPKDPWGS